MFNQLQSAKILVLSMSLLVAGSMIGLAQGGRNSDPFAGLKRAMAQAGAPALSATQETALTTLITEFKAGLPTEGGDDVLETAREAYEAAILAGDLAAAQVQITTITTRSAQLQQARMEAEAKFGIAAIAILKAGGQYDPLVAKYSADRVLSLVLQLAGRGGPGGDGPGGGRR